MAATQHLAAVPEVGPDAALRRGSNLLIERDWIDREFIDAHTHRLRRLRSSSSQPFTLDARRRRDAARRRGDRTSSPGTIHDGQARVVLVDDGRQPKPPGGAHRPGDHQPGADDRQHRPPRHRRQLDHRPVQRDGLAAVQQHDEPAGRPRLRQRRASPQSGRACSTSTSRRIPREASWPYHRILEGILRGEIRGLWVVATNPAHSWINQGTARDILDRLDFLVVQDMYHTTETAQLADLVLPAAGWGEKEGTFINPNAASASSSKVARAPGKALADFHIFKLIAEYWGCGEMFRRWESPEAVFQLLKQLSAGQPCDITGIDDYEMLDERGGIQWPFPAETASDRSSQSADCSRTASSIMPTAARRFHLRAAASAARAAEREVSRSCCSPAADRPRSGTRKLARPSRPCLRKLYPAELYVEINPRDATQHGHPHGRSRPRRFAARRTASPEHWSLPRSSRGKFFCRCTTRRQTSSPTPCSIPTRISRRTKRVPWR